MFNAIQGGEGSQRKLAKRFSVSRNFITKLLKLHKETGGLNKRPHGGGKPGKFTPEGITFLKETLILEADLTLKILITSSLSKQTSFAEMRMTA